MGTDSDSKQLAGLFLMNEKGEIGVISPPVENSSFIVRFTNGSEQIVTFQIEEKV